MYVNRVWGGGAPHGSVSFNYVKPLQVKKLNCAHDSRYINSAPIPEDGPIGDAAVKDMGTSRTSAGQSNVGIK